MLQLKVANSLREIKKKFNEDQTLALVILTHLLEKVR